MLRLLFILLLLKLIMDQELLYSVLSQFGMCVRTRFAVLEF